MNGMATLSLRFGTHPDVSELSCRLSALADRSLEIVPGLLDLSDRVGGLTSGAMGIDLYLAPANLAGEQRILLQLGERGFELLAAVRALDVPSSLSDEIGHGNSPKGDIGSAGGGVVPASRTNHIYHDRRKTGESARADGGFARNPGVSS